MFSAGLWEKTDTLLKKIMLLFALEKEKDSDFEMKCEKMQNKITILRCVHSAPPLLGMLGGSPTVCHSQKH